MRRIVEKSWFEWGMCLEKLYIAGRAGMCYDKNSFFSGIDCPEVVTNN